MNGARSQDGLVDGLGQVSSVPFMCRLHGNLNAGVGHLQPQPATPCARLIVLCALRGTCALVGLPDLTLSPL